ncbi:Chaperone protein DnaJ [Chlorella vulgaris]
MIASAAAEAAVAAARRHCAWLVGLQLRAARSYSSSAAEVLLHEYEQGRPPQVVPFQIGEEEARRRFLAWQSGTARLGPSGLLPPEGGGWHMRPALLPFWMFDVRARLEYAGSVGTADRQGGPLAWREVGWKELPERQYSWQQEQMLRVYASYKYRRDYAQVANSTWALKHLQPLPAADARAGCHLSTPLVGPAPLPADLDPPAMRQAIAWEFVLRGIREAEQEAARQRLLAATGAAAARDVRVRLHVLEHRAQLAFLPAFHLTYCHGEALNAHGERVPARYEALIGGTGEGGVAGTRHFSPRRASGGVLLAALGATAAASPLLGLDPWSLVNVETGFALLTASWLAGLAARMLPFWLHTAAEERRLRASDLEFEEVARLGLGPLDTGTEEQEVLRSAAEWRRWEGMGSDPWREAKRQLWAEELFEAQQRRRVQRDQLRERLTAERMRQEAEERREERRAQRWGRSSHHHFRRAGHHGDTSFSGGVRGGGRRDHLGFYHLLGLEAGQGGGGQVSQEDIKRAFRRAALRWHPDKQEVADERGKRLAREKFQAIRTAYDVLSHPEKRHAYDRGEVRRSNWVKQSLSHRQGRPLLAHRTSRFCPHRTHLRVATAGDKQQLRKELPHRRSALIAADSASRAAVAETLPGGGEYGAYITGVGAVLIAQSGAKAVKLRDDLAAMCRLNREVMHPRHKENVEKLKQTLQQCGMVVVPRGLYRVKDVLEYPEHGVKLSHVNEGQSPSTTGTRNCEQLAFDSSSAAEVLLHEYEQGRPPQVVPFQTGEEEARRRFLAWQSGTARLGPSGLLPPEGGGWHMHCCPFGCLMCRQGWNMPAAWVQPTGHRGNNADTPRE